MGKDLRSRDDRAIATKVHYASVIEALEAGEGYARNIALYTGKHISTVRKILVGYERDGIARRWKGWGGTPDYWVFVPPEHREDAARA